MKGRNVFRQLMIGVVDLVGLDVDTHVNMYVWDTAFESVLLVKYLTVK